MPRRFKLSTTVSPSTFSYLQSLIERGRARNLAEALDISVGGLRRVENRARLERDTAKYFESLSAQGTEIETRLEDALSQSADEIDFDAY